ncbi:conserved Sulfolobus plasmid protein [Acidianus hospitalis W1]|uniref:Conserved Sulfolobus plasmid protein n=1 Tax=Acidianus hospitalis (strain W1) TaxID=933801 RepID=F4B5K6_ACIHW|nr:transcriptional regulator [Acidianus hospitalis]AEE94430.1 conserved Sulfolobus plasmid protein [Acidianus hospitalis W1]
MERELTQKQKILLVLAKRGSLTLEELERYTKIPRNSLLKNLSELKKEGKITRGWLHIAGRKYRKYSIKTSILKELGIE